MVSSPRWNSFIQFLSETYQVDAEERQRIAEELVSSRDWPWVERDRATFVYYSHRAHSVALSLDIVDRDPPFEHLVRLEGTSLWYYQRYFDQDALLDYVFAVDDPGTPLAQEVDLANRVGRFWEADSFNALSIRTRQINTSVLQMPKARPFPDWEAMRSVPRGRVYRHSFSSVRLGFTGRSLWVYTPPNYDPNDGKLYPLLVFMDGQWAADVFEMPYIADALIKHHRMEPVMIAMLEGGSQSERVSEYVGNDRHYAMLLTELLPFLQAEYRIESIDLGLGGVGEGAAAAAHAALKNPSIFAHLILISPPLGRGAAAKQLQEYARRFRDSPMLPRRIFQSVGRYEQAARFYQPALALRGILEKRMRHDAKLDYKFVELGSGHSLAAFKSILPEALSHAFPANKSTPTST